MTLRQKQSKFALMIAKLTIRIYELGYETTKGDAYRDTRLHGAMGIKLGYGHRDSCHKIRLAEDINLFRGGGVFLESTKDHEPIGEIWESMGGSWGGRFNDGNHYSLEHEGKR